MTKGKVWLAGTAVMLLAWLGLSQGGGPGISPPLIAGVERQDGRLQFRLVCEPSYDYFVEFSESLAAPHWLSLTNFRVKIQTVEAVITDSLTNQPARFYRVLKQDCQCD